MKLREGVRRRGRGTRRTFPSPRIDAVALTNLRAWTDFPPAPVDASWEVAPPVMKPGAALANAIFTLGTPVVFFVSVPFSGKHRLATRASQPRPTRRSEPLYRGYAARIDDSVSTTRQAQCCVSVSSKVKMGRRAIKKIHPFP